MGAWGEGAFDNDDAADWSGEFEGADGDTGLEVVRSGLQAAAKTSGDDYLDSFDGAIAVAAAEIVAAMHGINVQESAYNEEALGWLATTNPPADDETVRLAVMALERVAAPQSELADVWDEAGDPSWRQAVDNRLASLRCLPQG